MQLHPGLYHQIVSDINMGGEDSGSEGRRAFVALAQIEKESVFTLELDSVIGYSNLVRLYLH